MESNYDIIYVMSGGKTGSKTLYYSFLRIYPISIHTHDASDVIHSTNLGKRILIVNSYREPVSRHISSFFHTFRDINFLNDIKNYDRLVNILERKLDSGDFFENYHPLVSFLDHYNKPLVFDKTRRWDFQKNILPNVDCLLLRFDQIKNWESQIRTIFRRFRIVPRNKTEDKHYYRMYKHFKKHYHPNASLLSTLIKDDNLLKTYYHDDEILQIIRDSDPENQDDISRSYHPLVGISPSET